MSTLRATFSVQMSPGEPIPAVAGRFDLTKTWTGEVEGTSHGIMLTTGDPATGNAGYIALETFEGVLDGRRGSLSLQQLGTMADGNPALEYVIAPGSGTGGLAGALGTVTIDGIDDDGTHHVAIELA